MDPKVESALGEPGKAVEWKLSTLGFTPRCSGWLNFAGLQVKELPKRVQD